MFLILQVLDLQEAYKAASARLALLEGPCLGATKGLPPAVPGDWGDFNLDHGCLQKMNLGPALCGITTEALKLPCVVTFLHYTSVVLRFPRKPQMHCTPAPSSS